MSEQSGPQKPTPNKSSLQSIAENMEDGAIYNKLLRKCRTRNCVFDGKHSFKKAFPDGSTQYMHAFCDRMDCDHCGAYKTGILRKKITAAAREHGLHYCYTLTVGGDLSVKEGFEVAQNALKNLKARYKRKFGRPLRYIWVKGLSTRKRPHLHILTDSNDMSRSWIRERWYPVTGGQQIHIQENSEDELERMANYMVINWLECYVRGYRGRKHSASKGIDVAVKPRKEQTSEGWERVEVSTSQVAKQLPDYQPKVVEVNPPSVKLPPKDPERSEGYPPQDADQGRRVEANAEGGGWSTSGKSAPGGAELGDPENENPDQQAAS